MFLPLQSEEEANLAQSPPDRRAGDTDGPFFTSLQKIHLIYLFLSNLVFVWRLQDGPLPRPPPLLPLGLRPVLHQPGPREPLRIPARYLQRRLSRGLLQR